MDNKFPDRPWMESPLCSQISVNQRAWRSQLLPTGEPTLVPEPSRSCLSSSGTEKSLIKASTSSLPRRKQTTAFKAFLSKDATAPAWCPQSQVSGLQLWPPSSRSTSPASGWSSPSHKFLYQWIKHPPTHPPTHSHTHHLNASSLPPGPSIKKPAGPSSIVGKHCPTSV